MVISTGYIGVLHGTTADRMRLLNSIIELYAFAPVI